MSVVHGIDGADGQGEAVVAGKILAVLLECLKADDVPRRGRVFNITRAGPKCYHFETKAPHSRTIGRIKRYLPRACQQPGNLSLQTKSEGTKNGCGRGKGSSR